VKLTSTDSQCNDVMVGGGGAGSGAEPSRVAEAQKEPMVMGVRRMPGKVGARRSQPHQELSLFGAGPW
jgi:hypothetical protein